MSGLFYKPAGAWAADFIPFFRDGTFHLFYLLDWRDRTNHGEGTPWYQVSTRDFAQFTEHGEMLARGTVEEPDLYVFTGSVIEADGQFHIFYTGHNPHQVEKGLPREGVLRAVSDDLVHWQKAPDALFTAPAEEGYEPHDWRDPFVFWNEEAGEYWMLLAARRTDGPSRRRGCTALCASKDLHTWEVRESFWSPGLYYTHECPDVFRMGDWWYLVFSEFSDRSVTRYRMSRSLSGPWLPPANDTFDGRAHYAAKTASDGQRRYLFGWLATREGEKDTGPYQWGGSLVAHEVVQEADGTLSVRIPESVAASFPQAVPFAFRPGLGESVIAEESVTVTAPCSFGCAVAGALPEVCKLDATVTFAEGTQGCGLMLRASDDLEAAYYIRLEPARNRLVLDSWPRAGDLPFWVELERPLTLTPGTPVSLTVLLDGTHCVVYAADRVAMSARLYNLKEGNWGVFTSEGRAEFRRIQVQAR